MDISGSLDTFGTLAFGREVMLDSIRLVAGRIDAGTWLGLIPEVYRAKVAPLIERVFVPYSGRKATDDAIRAYVLDLHQAIWQHLSPVPWWPTGANHEDQPR